MFGIITDEVISELLGRGLSYKQWRLVLEGIPFDDSIGGRYYTEWQRIWQCSFSCARFQYTSTTKQRIIEQEFNIFRSEIECMVLEGHSWKAIARRLRGDVWTSDGRMERGMRLKMLRLFGCDARSHMFKAQAKRWQLEAAQEAKLFAARKAQSSTIFKADACQTKETSQNLVRPVRKPESLVIKDSGRSFRCSFSAISALALQDRSPLDIPQKYWTSSREANLCQIVLNLTLGAQQTKQELRAIKEDLLEIRDRFRDHENAIGSLEADGWENEAFEKLSRNEMFISIARHEQDEYDDGAVRCHPRRRGRIFPSTKKAVHLKNHSQSKIPIRTSPCASSLFMTGNEPPTLPRRNDARPFEATKVPYAVDTSTLQHMRGRSQDRDSGYNSPSSTYSSSSTGTIFAVKTRLDSVWEGCRRLI